MLVTDADRFGFHTGRHLSNQDHLDATDANTLKYKSQTMNMSKVIQQHDICKDA